MRGRFSVISPVIVIGGGFAGLSAAVRLADSGVRVLLLEAKSSLGGRARSFVDPTAREVVDNGQHLFLGAYQETLRFLDRLGTRDRLVFQKRLRVTFVEPGGRTHRLSCPMLPAPWHLLVGMANLSSLSLRDKWSLRRIGHALANGGTSSPGLDRLTVEEWLTRWNQSERSRRCFWYPLAVATLNEDPSRASAVGFVAVLRVLWTQPWSQARLGMAVTGLSDLYTEQAKRIIEQKGGAVFLNRPVAGLEIEGDGVQAVRLANGDALTAQHVVSALPPSILCRILPVSFLEGDPVFRHLKGFSTSPIVSINLWLDRPVTTQPFVGMIGARIQWLFNKSAILGRGASYLSLIVSAASPYVDQPNERIVAIAWEDLISCFPRLKGVRMLRAQVVREREATVSLTPETEPHRPGPRTPLKNLFLAGDWTATGLPATIESAVVSGRACAEAILSLQ